MPHDKNGVEVNPGDVVKIQPEGEYRPHEVVAAVMSVQKGSETCNLTVEGVLKSAYKDCPALPRVTTLTVTAKDVEKIA